MVLRRRNDVVKLLTLKIACLWLSISYFGFLVNELWWQASVWKRFIVSGIQPRIAKKTYFWFSIGSKFPLLQIFIFVTRKSPDCIKKLPNWFQQFFKSRHWGSPKKRIVISLAKFCPDRKSFNGCFKTFYLQNDAFYWSRWTQEAKSLLDFLTFKSKKQAWKAL